MQVNPALWRILILRSALWIFGVGPSTTMNLLLPKEYSESMPKWLTQKWPEKLRMSLDAKWINNLRTCFPFSPIEMTNLSILHNSQNS